MVNKKDYDPKTEKLNVKTVLGEEPTPIEILRAAETTRKVTKLALQDQKILAIHVTFDINGKFEIFYFGAAPEISKRSAYLAKRIGDALPQFVIDYDMPHVDITKEPAKS